jgi:DNA repair protein RadA/Sms
MALLSQANATENVLYVSGEESVSQVADRAKRLEVNANSFYIYNETNWQKVLEQIHKLKPKFLVIDSIQTTTSSEIDSAPGTASQIREVTYELMNNVKSSGITCFVIGHITKEGSIAGPKILEHMVDTVIYFEGDQFGQYRILRAIKNRFGNTNEVGIFEMKENGLQEVKNPSQFFLDEELEGAFGRSLTCILEGSRSLFVEIQALVVENKFGNGRRTTQGVDNNRLAMMVAVIEKYFGIPLGFNDIYLNVVGGMKLSSRESDLSIIASLISSYRLKPIDPNTVFVGEVGLTGEVRSVPMMEARIKEMAQLNYKRVITSEKTSRELKGKFKIDLVGIRSAKEIEKYI